MDTDAWESSKENVLPLKGGRCVKKIERTFGDVSDVVKTTQQQERTAIKEEFETAILNDEVDDPLETWLSYISWCRQEFPDGNNGDTLKLYERCARKFVDYEQYRNDTRYLRIWLNFADGATDPVDIFKFLKSREIGVTLALLYEAYSLALETKGSKKQASLVYEEGIQNNAQPLERLKRRHREYQMRLTEDLKANMEAMSFGALADSNDGRKTLGRLARTRNGLLPVHHSRDGHQQQSTRPSTKRRASNTGGVSVFVDDDEENQPPSQETAAKVWSHVPSGASVRKENTLTAGRWTGGGRSEDAPVSVGYHPLEFPVFHDESNEDSADRHSLPARMLDHTGPSLQESRKRGEELMQNPLQNFRKPAKNFDGSGAWDQLDRLPLVDANGGEVSIEEVRAQSSAYKYTDSGANPSANIKGGEPNVDMEIDTDVTSQKRPQDDTHTQPIPRKILDFTTPALNQLKTPLCVSNSINAGRGILFSSSVSDRHVDSSADLAHSRPTNRDAITSQKRLKIDADSQRPSMSAASSSGQPVPKPRPTVKGVSSLQTPPNADTDKSNPSISVPASKENVPSTSVDASPSSTTVHATSETVPTSTANVLVKQSGEPVSKSGSPASEPDIPSLTVGTVPAIPNEPSTTARQDHTASNTEATSNASPLLSTSESSAAVTDSRPVKEVGGIHSAQSASSIFVDEPSMSDVNEVDTKSVSTRESGPNALGFDMFMDDTEKLDDVVAGAAHSVEADARSSPTPALAPSGINTSSNAHGKISDDLYKKEAAPLVVVTSLTNGNSLPGGDHQETQRDESVHTASASHPLTGTSNENASAGDEELKGEQGVVIKREVNAANVYEATREGGGDSPHVGSVDAGGVGDFRVPFESGHVDGDQEHRENARPNLDSYRIGDSDEETNDVANKEKHPPISPTITTKLATADLFDIFRSRPLPGDEDGDTLHSMPFLGGADRPVSASGVSPTHNRDFNHPMFGADKTASCSTSTAEPFQIFQDPTMTGTILPLPPPAKTAYDSQESEELSNAVLAESKSIFQDPENNENDPNVFDGARKNPTDRVSHLVMRTEGERKPITPLEVVPDEVQDIDEDQKGQGDMLGQSEGRVTNADVLREGGMMPLDSSFSRSPGIKSTSGDVLADGNIIRSTANAANESEFEIFTENAEPLLVVATEEGDDDDFVVFEDHTATAPDASRSLAAIGHPLQKADSADSAVDSDEDVSRSSEVALNISAGDNALAPHMSSVLRSKRGSNLSLILETSRDGDNAMEMHTPAPVQESAITAAAESTSLVDEPLAKTEVTLLSIDADSDILRNPVSDESLLFMNEHVLGHVQGFVGYHQSSESLAIPFDFQVPGSFTLANGDTVFIQTVLKPGREKADPSMFLLVTPDDEDAPDITAMLDDCSQSCGLSVSPSPSTWEFYLSRTFYSRFETSPQQSGYKAIPWMTTYHVYRNAHMYTTAHSDYCTIQDLINSTHSTGEPLEEAMVLFYTIELLKAVQILHSNQIVINGFCSDKILLRHGNMMSLSDVWDADGSGGWEDHGLFLEDLSKGIDMNLFSNGTKFTGPMPRWGSIPNREEWSYEVDMFDVANTIHKLMHGSGLALKNVGKQWMPSTVVPSTWRVELWNSVLRDLINFEDGAGKSSAQAVQCLRIDLESVLQSDEDLSRRIKKLLLRQSITLYNNK